MTRQLRWASQRLTMANTELEMMLGNRRLSDDGWTAMLMVLDAIDGDILAVRKGARRLRKSGKGVEEVLAGVKDRKYAGRGPLHMAAWAGRLEMCKYLVKDLRLDVNRVGDEGLTPLIYAIIGCGSTSVVRFLLDRGANPNKADAKGFTPLHYATMTGTDTDSTEASSKWAANTRDTCEIAELLLSRGACVDPICKKGTPLLVSAQSGNERMVELLLRHQANPNRVMYLHYTPLIMAIFASSVKCAELLIKAGADVNAVRPVTPLAVAASHGFTDCVKCLLEAGADANIPAKGGKTPAEIAVAQGWMDCAEILSPLTSPACHDDAVFGENEGWALNEQGGEENSGFALKMQWDAAFESMVLKMQGNAAAEEHAYADALALYTKAMESDPYDSTLYVKRSLCWLQLNEEDLAWDDAKTYKCMEVELANSRFEKAAALMMTKEYAQACQALMSGLKLDLRSDDLD